MRSRTRTNPGAGQITVNVTSSIPNGLFSCADTFDVGSQTMVLGSSSDMPFRSLGNVATGDIVAGGLIVPRAGSAWTLESTPLQVRIPVGDHR